MPIKTVDVDTGKCRVEFRLPAESGAERAWLVGDFNDWSTEACPMEPQDDGSLAVQLLLEAGTSYRFRYFLGDDRWENDWAADAYVENDQGGSDSVVTLPVAVSELAPPGPLGDGAGRRRAREAGPDQHDGPPAASSSG